MKKSRSSKNLLIQYGILFAKKGIQKRYDSKPNRVFEILQADNKKTTY